MNKSAIISDCGQYRYLLTRDWSMGVVDRGLTNTCLFVMLNPSTADAEIDDRTIRRCIGFCESWGFNRLEVVNLSAYRSTDPKGLWAEGVDPIGLDNNTHIRAAVEQTNRVVVAWGVETHPLVRGRARTVLSIIRALKSSLASAPIMALGRTKWGSPRHPLFVPKNTNVMVYE